MSYISELTNTPSYNHKNDKRARYQGSYSESQTRGKDSYDRPRQRFQQGQTSRPVQAALPVSEGGQYQQSGPSTGQNSRGSDSFPPCHGRVTTGRSTSGCYDCGALDHWSRECPRRGRGVIVPAPPTSKPVSAVSSSARGGGQIQDRRESRQVTRGGARGGRSQHNLAIAALFHIFILINPMPPSLLGQHTFSHAIKAFFVTPPTPDHK
uniref:CCHC-type domain-containing protein n=1 Tax=Solanum lycopersicum TaxID=4081 RepID=A0A3Q7EXM6_SOLLC